MTATNGSSANKVTSLATVGDFSAKQIKLVKHQLMVDKDGNTASDGELYLFLEVCKVRRLDPFKKQIYAVARWVPSFKRMVWAYQVSIEGLRGMAERTKERDGTDGPYWCGADGQWTDVWLDDEAPLAAKVTVFRKGHRHPYTATAQMSFYRQTKSGGEPTQMWTKGGGAHMLGKCAEALALRKGFPEECGGLYIDEEMQQTTNIVDAELVEDPSPFDGKTPDEIDAHMTTFTAISQFNDPQLKAAIMAAQPDDEHVRLRARWQELKDIVIAKANTTPTAQ